MLQKTIETLWGFINFHHNWPTWRVMIRRSATLLSIFWLLEEYNYVRIHYAKEQLSATITRKRHFPAVVVPGRCQCPDRYSVRFVTDCDKISGLIYDKTLFKKVEEGSKIQITAMVGRKYSGEIKYWEILSYSWN